MFGNSVIIQLMQLQNAQKTYQIKDMDRVYILIKFFCLISFENVEKSEAEKPNFWRGGQIWPPPLVLKGLSHLHFIFG